MARRKPFKEYKEVKCNRKRFSQQERRFIFTRDNFTCNLCQKDLYNSPNDRILDHIIPLHAGGSNRLNNIWLLCFSCDNKKGSELLPDVIEARINYLKTKLKSR